MNLKKYIFGIFFLCIAAVAVFFSMSKSVYTVYDKNVGHVMHMITADMKHERTISWKTADFEEAGYLEVRPKQSGKIIKIKGEAAVLPSYNSGSRFMLYTAHMDQLMSGTNYEYRIQMGKRQSEWREFQTEPESAAFKALIFGDSQSANYKDWAETAQLAWERNQDAAFFINMGDLVDNGQDDWQWNAWFDGAGRLLEKIPAAPVMGNHEAYNLDWKMALPHYYLALFSTPANGPAGLERYAYSYDYGDVHFVVLNTQLQELGEWYPDLLEEQRKWLDKDLARTAKPWKIVLMHRGVWEYPFQGPLDEIGEAFVPLFDKYHVNLVFIGHVHSYARTKPMKKGREDSAGTVYITTGRSGDKVWDKSPKKPMDEYYYNPLDMPNYLVLEASKDRLKVFGYKQKGELFDQIEIKAQK